MGDAERLEALVEEARSGDARARDLLARASADRIRSWVRALVGRKLERKVTVEDLVQEVFFQMFRGLRRLRWRGEAAFWAWVRRIAHDAVCAEANRADARKRSPGREVSLQEEIRSSGGSAAMLEGLVEGSGETPSQGLARQERFERLARAFRSLRPDHREVILLGVVKRLPMKEVAARMDRSVPAVSMLLWRAVRALGKAFGRIDGSDSMRLPPDRTLDPEDDGHGRDPDER